MAARFCEGVFCFTFVLLLAPGPICGVEPGPGRELPEVEASRPTSDDLPAIPEFGTEAARKLDHALLRLWQRDIEAYQRLTKDPPQIRGQAARFMRLVHATMLPTRRVKKRGALSELGEAIVEKGSQDVLLRGYLGWAYMVDRDYERAASLIASTLKEWDHSGYPTEMQHVPLTGFTRMLRDLTSSPGDLWRIQLNLTDSLARYFNSRFEDATITEDLERAVYFEITEICGNVAMLGPVASRLPDLYRLRLEKSSPWLRSMVTAMQNKRWAWGARGHGFAYQVSPEEWQRFYEYSSKAVREWQKAIDLRPDYPEAYTEMIEISMATGRYGTPREWFKKAVAVQFDWIPAYHAYLMALTPRWGGSLSEIMQFGRECAATRRFDTNVPYFFLLAMHQINFEMGLTHEIWRVPGVFEQAIEVLEAFENEPAHDGELAIEPSRAYLATTRLMVAARAHRFDEFRQIYKSLDGQPDEIAMRAWHTQPPLILSELLAWSSPARPFLEETRALLRADREKPSDEALLRAKDALERAIAHADDPMAKAFCSAFRNWVEWRLAFRTGGWVEVRFDEHLLSWWTMVGRWEREDERTVVGRSDYETGTVWAQLPYSPPPPVEIELEIEAEVPRTAFDLFGIGIRHPESHPMGSMDYLLGIRYNTNEAEVRFDDSRKVAPAKLGRRNLLKVQLADQHVVLWVNGERCLDIQEATFHPAGLYNFGVFVPIAPPRTFRIANIRFRKWSDPERSEGGAAPEHLQNGR